MNATTFYHLVYDNKTNISSIAPLYNTTSVGNLTSWGNVTTYWNWNGTTALESTTRHLISGAFSDDIALNAPYTVLLILTTITGNLGKNNLSHCLAKVL